MSLSSIWQNLGLSFVIVLAGLQAVPEEVLEAATLDGFGPVRRFFRVTVPLLSPVLMFLVVVLRVRVPGLRPDRHPHPGRAAAGATETLVFKIFNSQSPGKIGAGAVLAIGLFGVTLFVTLAPVPHPRPAGALWELTRRRDRCGGPLMTAPSALDVRPRSPASPGRI